MLFTEIKPLVCHVWAMVFPTHVLFFFVKKRDANIAYNTVAYYQPSAAKFCQHNHTIAPFKYIFKSSQAHVGCSFLCSSLNRQGTCQVETNLWSKCFFRIVCTLPSDKYIYRV